MAESVASLFTSIEYRLTPVHYCFDCLKLNEPIFKPVSTTECTVCVPTTILLLFCSFSFHQTVPWLHRASWPNKAMGFCFTARLFFQGFSGLWMGSREGKAAGKEPEEKRVWKKEDERGSKDVREKLWHITGVTTWPLYLFNLSAAVKGK